jgi:hypothetical protein
MAEKKLEFYLPIEENKEAKARLEQLKRTIANPTPIIELPEIKDEQK